MQSVDILYLTTRPAVMCLRPELEQFHVPLILGIGIIILQKEGNREFSMLAFTDVVTAQFTLNSHHSLVGIKGIKA